MVLGEDGRAFGVADEVRLKFGASWRRSTQGCYAGAPYGWMRFMRYQGLASLTLHGCTAMYPVFFTIYDFDNVWDELRRRNQIQRLPISQTNIDR